MGSGECCVHCGSVQKQSDSTQQDWGCLKCHVERLSAGAMTLRWIILAVSLGLVSGFILLLHLPSVLSTEWLTCFLISFVGSSKADRWYRWVQVCVSQGQGQNFKSESTWWINIMILRSCGCFTCAETDVDEGHDWDIFNVNEGLWNPNYCFLFLNNMCMRLFHWPLKCIWCRGCTGLPGGRYSAGGSKLVHTDMVVYLCLLWSVWGNKCVLRRVLSDFPYEGRGPRFSSIRAQN